LCVTLCVVVLQKWRFAGSGWDPPVASPPEWREKGRGRGNACGSYGCNTGLQLDRVGIVR
jgi:hypothetical protein